MDNTEKNYIKARVAKALDTQFEIYSWKDMIKDCGLTYDQAKWAINELSYKVVEIKEEYSKRAINRVVEAVGGEDENSQL